MKKEEEIRALELLMMIEVNLWEDPGLRRVLKIEENKRFIAFKDFLLGMGIGKRIVRFIDMAIMIFLVKEKSIGMIAIMMIGTDIAELCCRLGLMSCMEKLLLPNLFL